MFWDYDLVAIIKTKIPSDKRIETAIGTMMLQEALNRVFVTLDLGTGFFFLTGI